MSVYYLTFRSVTLAQRGESALTGEGVRCTIARTPRWMEERGCGYSLRIRTDAPDWCAEILRRRGIEFRKVYRRRGDGEIEEVAV